LINKFVDIEKQVHYAMAESLQTEGTGDILSTETQFDPFAKSESEFAPNDFYHVISDVMDWGNNSNSSPRPQSLSASRVTMAHYHILVLIIPNDHINVRETIFKFVEASHKAPLSIVIFGIALKDIPKQMCKFPSIMTASPQILSINRGGPHTHTN
jgi:hypothetical protein